MTKLGPMHFRGQRPNYFDLVQMQRQGVKTIFNLERGYFEMVTGTVNKLFQGVAGLAMIPIHMELGDIIAPTFEECEAARNILKRTDVYGPTYLCCLHGKDRTGIISAYMNYKDYGMSFDQAILNMYQNGFNQTLYEPLGWVSQLRKYCGQ